MSALPEVAAFEDALLGVARALLAAPGAAGAELTARLAGAYQPAPGLIGPTAAQLLGDTLALAWPALWRRGAVPGARPWAQPPLALRFGAPTLELLRWLVITPLPHGKAALAATGPLALGDEVMVYLALAATEAPALRAAIAAQPLVRGSALVWLGFADALGATGALPAADFAPLAVGAGALVVAALAPELARRWRAADAASRALVDPARLVAIGAAQDATLAAWFAACDAHRRRDLAGFVLDAAAPLVARGVPPPPAALARDAPLSLRSRARLATGALLRGVQRWAAWDAQHRGVRFLDDDYAEAQRLLARFEAVGPAGAERAAAALAALAALPDL